MVVPPQLLLAIAHNGGFVALGYADGDERPAGFVFGFVGIYDYHFRHHSHMLAVRETYRGSGLAKALKEAQRDHCLDQGIEVIAWTMDPLEARNATFNFAKLGSLHARVPPRLLRSDARQAERGAAIRPHLRRVAHRPRPHVQAAERRRQSAAARGRRARGHRVHAARRGCASWQGRACRRRNASLDGDTGTLPGAEGTRPRASRWRGASPFAKRSRLRSRAATLRSNSCAQRTVAARTSWCRSRDAIRRWSTPMSKPCA